jgi:dTDP-4-amino-4,6-dideoxygalactose transaminase
MIKDFKFNVSGIEIITHNNPIVFLARHLYQIRVKHRNEVIEFLNKHDIYPGVHYKDNTQYDVYSYGFGHLPYMHTN